MSRTVPRLPPVVLKFGGASLAQPQHVVRTVLEARASDGPVVVVVSAREKVTDLLLEAVRRPRDERQDADDESQRRCYSSCISRLHFLLLF